MIYGLSKDMQFAVRALARRKTFSFAVIGTLALGIGANTAVFSVVDALVLRPLSLANSRDLVTTYESAARNPYGASAFATYQQLVANKRSLADVATFFATSMSIGDGDAIEERTGALVTDNYFRLLGVTASRGRVLGSGDTTIDGRRVAVISHQLWQTKFGADPHIVGRTLNVAGQNVTVVGVADERFRGTSLVSSPDLWLPISLVRSLQLGLLSRMDITAADADVRLFTILGRLRPGASAEQAERDANAELARSTNTSVSHGHLSVIPINEGATTLRDRTALMRFVRLLMTVVAVTLLLACLNIANLLFVRGRERAKEIGVRAALGASAPRLVRELMCESMLLAFIGGAAGVGIAFTTLRLLSSFELPGGVVLGQLAIGLDGRILAFAALLSVGTALVFGLAPAVNGSRVDVVTVIRDEYVGGTSNPGRGVLLVVQIAVTFVLLVGAVLMVRSLRRGLQTDLGFDPSHLAAVTVQTNLEGRQADNARAADQILRALGNAPGISVAAASSHLPLAPGRGLPFAEGAAGSVPAALRRTTMTYLAAISPDYFRALGVPLLKGRFPGNEDREDTQRVVVVNEAAAHAFWPDGDALGKQINLFDDRTYTVIGVVRDTKYISLQDQGVPFAFAPISQEEVRGTLSFVVRAANPRIALQTLQSTITSTAPTWRLTRPRLVSEQIDAALMPQRFGAMLLSVFSLVALVVSSVGVYGTVAYAMERRRTEIGVRMALGAQSGDVLRVLLRESAIALGAGLIIGLAVATMSSRLLSHFLYQIEPLDPPSFIAAVLGVLVAAVAAVLVPASRAVRVDPVRAIRSQ